MVGDIDATPRPMAPRRRFEARAAIDPVENSSDTDDGASVPTTCAMRFHLAERPATGAQRPSMRNDSPARRGIKRVAIRPCATTEYRTPFIDTTVETPLPRATGSLTRVATPRHSPTTGRLAPCHADEPPASPHATATRQIINVRRLTSTSAMAASTTTTRAWASRGTCSPARVEHHSSAVRTATLDVFESVLRLRPAPYDRCVPASPSSSRSRPSLPGGLAATRKLVRRRGGLAALGVAIMIALVGRIIGWFVGGAAGGAISFASLVMAIPVMPILGMPAAGGGARLLAALVLSSGIWWFVGQAVAGRVTRRPVAGWREWTLEFLIVGSGVWAGALGGLVLGAVALGAF